MSDFAPLLEAVLAGSASVEEQADFAQRIAGDETLRREYTAQMKLHALLEWRSGRVGHPAMEGAPMPKKVVVFPQLTPLRKYALVMAALFMVLCAVGTLLWTRGEKTNPPVAMEVLHATGAVLAGDLGEARVGARFALRTLELRSGLLRVRLDSGVILGAEAPATIELLSALHVRVLSGRITADAGAAHGFTVETARTRVVDLGTRFGVDASTAGADIVVFDGAVQLHGDQTAESQRLEQGEAVRIGVSGAQQRIVNVSAGAEPEQWSAGAGGLFRAVRDNRRTEDAPKFYQVVPGGLREDTRAYVDRTHEWNGLEAGGLPKFLLGADFVRTFNDDKRETDLEITVELAKPATLYLFLDRKPPPSWVTRAGFTDLDLKIGLDEGPSPNRTLTTAAGPGVSIERVFSVYRLEIREPRTVTLGPPREGPTGAKGMYGIAAQPLSP